MFSKRSAACFGKRSLVRPMPLFTTTLARDEMEQMHDNTELEREAHEKAETSKQIMLEEEHKIREKEYKIKMEKENAERIKKEEELRLKTLAAEEAKKAQPVAMDFSSVPETHFLEKPAPKEQKKEQINVQLSTPLGEKKVYYTQILNSN